ncbi:MAG: cytochrome oxidase subunit III [Flavobacteriales bacterium]|nr:MAG: cytochrome oxidase subunit III [Flavobacteriales bacterium]
MDLQIRRKASKQMLYIAIISMIMMFAGLTSAYIISSKREDWVSFSLPNALYISTLLIVISSVMYSLAQASIKNNNKSKTTLFLFATLIFGVLFVIFQIVGFYQLKEAGLYFTGASSVVSSSLLVAISFAHILHVLAGLIVLSVIISKHLSGKYSDKNYLGVELGGIFWHFVDVLWLALFLFFLIIT